MSQFAKETAVERVGDMLWRGELCQGWRVGSVPNGGYVLAVAGRALSEALPHKDPLSVSAFYLAPTALGPVDCHIDVLRSGRTTTFAEVKMYQEGELKVQVTAAYTDLGSLQGENWSSSPRPLYPSWDECENSGEKRMEYRERAEARLVTGSEVFTRREANGSGEFCGWLRHRDGSDPDAISLLMFADVFPPPAFTVFGPVGWVPTLELSVQVRAHPTPGPLQARLVSRHITRGVIEEDGEFWDSSGKLVAISRQTAKLRVPPPQ